MSNIPIESVRSRLIEALALRGLADQEAAIIADDLLDAEMSDVKTHGVAKLAVISEAIRSRSGSPIVIKDSSVYALVDGQRELGQLAANYCVDLLIDKAQTNGVGVVGLLNASRYGRLAPYAKRLSQSGLIGIVMNCGGPAAVAPYGSYAPILGTNPICMAFPDSKDGIVIDLSTAQAVWGEIRRAILAGRDLPSETFYKSDGSFAVNPQDANAVKAFDGAKGYALCLAIEILCGAFVGAKMGLAVESEYDLGFLFMALNPTIFRSSTMEFQTEVDALVTDIRNAPPLEPGSHVRIPGDHAATLKKKCEQIGLIDLDDRVWEMVCNMASDREAGLENSSLTN